jgi:hypothetical protein
VAAYLPANWVLVSASGEGEPQVGNGEIVFTDSLANNPLVFNFSVYVPERQSGNQTIGGEVEYLLDGMVNPELTRATPDPLQLTGYHSADYRSNYWVIDGTEVNRVLSYWRATNYQCYTGTPDGYAAGSGSTDCVRHGADYRQPYWFIDGSEMNRVLSYWRAGGYHCDPVGFDGYAANVFYGLWLSETKSQNESFSAIQQTVSFYQPDSTLYVTNKITYSGTLLSLLLRPQLPTGWAVAPSSVVGEGVPELVAGEIVWTGASIPPSPITIVYSVNVPNNANGAKQISAEVEYQSSGMINPVMTRTTPDPLVIKQMVWI